MNENDKKPDAKREKGITIPMPEGNRMVIHTVDGQKAVLVAVTVENGVVESVRETPMAGFKADA